MLHIGIYEAKNRFTEVLHIANSGEDVVITKHGKPVAVVQAYSNDNQDVLNAIDELNNLAQNNSLKGIDVKSLIEEGRS